MQETQERRSYYRINDLVGLSYKILDGQQQEEGSEQHGDSVSAMLTQIDQEFNQLTNILWQENPTTARALGLINQKLSIVADRVFIDNLEERFLEEEDMLMVNISGSGIAFKCAEPLHKKNRLELTLTLKPSNIKLTLTGLVVGCEKRSDNGKKPYWARVAFEESNGATQEQLIQHIVQKQYAQIKEVGSTDSESEKE